MWTFSLGYGAILGVLVAISLSMSVSALWSVRRKHRHAKFESALRSIKLELAEIADNYEKLLTLSKKKAARDTMRKRREQDGGLPDPNSDPEGWKKEMAKRHALGEWRSG